MFMRVDRLITDLPPPKKQDPNAAAALQELLGGKYGEMSTLGNYMFQSFNFRSKSKLRPFYSLVAAITAEELGHVELVSNGIATTGTLVFLISWGEFLYAVNFFLTPGKYPLSALLAQQVSAYGINWPGLMALTVITSIPILILFSFTYRFLKEGLTLGAVK